MIKLHLTSKSYGNGTWEFNTQAEADAWAADKISKKEFGDTAPIIYVPDIPSNAKSSKPYMVEQYDENGNKQNVQAKDVFGNLLFECIMPPEFEITFEDMTKDPVWKLAECYRLRKLEYPSAEEMIVALWEKDKAAIEAIEAKRQAVKLKYPKP